MANNFLLTGVLRAISPYLQEYLYSEINRLSFTSYHLSFNSLISPYIKIKKVLEGS